MSYMKQTNKKQKQTLESAQHGLEIIFKNTYANTFSVMISFV